MKKAEPGDKVRIHYTGKLEDGTVFDSSADGEPFEFTLGQQGILPALGQAVEGMTPGDKKTLQFPADQGFGLRNEELVQEVKRSLLPDNVEVGMQLRATAPGNRAMVVTVAAVKEKTAVLDANHPLAGRDLTFDIELLGFV